MDAYQALEKLIARNKRYVTERYARPDIGSKKRSELAKGQQPFAAILGCADSRICPELIFDQGLGALYIVRTAGLVVDAVVLGSIEFAVEYLDVRLLLVLGHDDCGAVKATITGKRQPFYLQSLVHAISPAVEAARDSTGEILQNAIRANVSLNVAKLKLASPVIVKAIDTNGLQIIGAMHTICDGNVSFDLD